MAILADLTQTEELSLEQQIAQLRAENAKLKAKTVGRLSLRVSEKGGVSLYGVGRFPVTLYRGQWEKVIAHAGDIRQFILDNSAALSEKD